MNEKSFIKLVSDFTQSTSIKSRTPTIILAMRNRNKQRKNDQSLQRFQKSQ